MQCSVQDLGRFGWRSIGVGPGGSTDEMAARIANLLVGNLEDAAGLEFTLAGPELRFERDVWIAIGGGEFAGLASWTPHRVTAGTTLRIGEARQGCRGFLAVSGGIDVPKVLGGCGAHLRAGFGGGFGRALRAGDALPVDPDDGGAPRGRWRIDPRLLPRYSADAEVRLIPRDGFAPDGGKTGWLKVSPKSDRMGLRLEDPLPLGEGAANLASAPVAPGVVQVPPDGRPIVLLADAQTIGGYPQLGQVATVDLPVVAQLRPGERMRFRMITLAEARERLAARERGLALLREGLKERRA
jgi:antagonist of KipI